MRPNIFHIPTITLHRPWALWVMMGWKTIETRLHAKFAGLGGKRIAIHAGLKWDLLAMHMAGSYLTEAQKLLTFKWSMEHAYAGQIVALADVDGTGWLSSQESHARKALIECHTARFGLYLKNIVPYTSPVIKGGRGIFYVTTTLCRQRFHL